MTGYFLMTFAALAALELIKGLSANGTPPVLQRFSWQMDLAHFMWSSILFFRIAFVAALVWMFVSMPEESRMAVIPGGIVFGALWGFIYWLFRKGSKRLPATKWVWMSRFSASIMAASKRLSRLTCSTTTIR